MAVALVTGGCGFAGRFLAEQLAVDGSDVHVTSHEGHGSAPDQARVHVLDVRDADAVAALVRDTGATEVYHLAGLTRPASQDVRGFWDVNFGGARNVLDAAVAAPTAPRVLLVGSAYAYAPSQGPIDELHPLAPTNHYGASKAAAEQAGRAYASDGLHVVLARPFNHSGPGQSPDFVLPTIVEQVARSRAAGAREVELELGNLDSVRDISDVRDIARGYVELLRGGEPGEAYNLGSGRGRSIRELVDLVAQQADIEVSIRQVGDRMRHGDVSILVADVERAGALGWHPSIGLDRTVSEMLAAHAAAA